jgi:CRP-like cAMP-binding protein
LVNRLNLALGLDKQTLERRSLARSEALFRQGEKVTAIGFVEAGRLRLDPSSTLCGGMGGLTH